MAEFLIKAIDDPAPLRYKRGDIVEVYEDGRCREAPSPTSQFVIVKVPGVPKAKVDRLIEAHQDTTDPLRPLLLARRRYHVRLADVPLAIRNALATQRQVTVTPAQIVGFIRNKATGLDLTAF